MTIASSIDQFLVSLQNAGSSPYTSRNYRHYLGRFLAFCRHHSPPLVSLVDISPLNLEAYQHFLNNFLSPNGLPLKRVTKCYHLIALRSLVRFLKSRGLINLFPKVIALPKIVRSRSAVVAGEDIDRLLLLPMVSKLVGLRDRVILELLIFCGLTVSELVGLNRQSIDLTNKTITVNNPRRKRQLILPKRVVFWLSRYQLTRGDHYPPLFIRYAGKKVGADDVAEGLRLTARSVERLVSKYGRLAGISIALTPQILRHSFAVSNIKHGVNTRLLQQMLGHKSLASTKAYHSLVTA